MFVTLVAAHFNEVHINKVKALLDINEERTEPSYVGS